jgi:DNA polymerase III delta prime subunit
MEQREEFLWVEKYRPHTISDTVLPSELKSTFQQFIDQDNIPNLILSGGPGVGKTTVARAMLDELGADYIIINGSMHGNIDTLRNEIMQFASAVSFTGGRKYVILDEADYLNANSTQPALRNFMEEFSKNCGFILTCNFKNRIISPLHSRCSVIDFTIKSPEAPQLASNFFKRVQNILQKENIEYDQQTVAAFIQKHFPDWRRVLNELQRYSAIGKIDSGILADLTEVSIKSLIDHMRGKNYSNVRKWVAENIHNDSNRIFRKLYDQSSDLFKSGSIPQLVLTLADYQYKSAFVADQEVNLAACLAEIMVQCELKK